MRVKLGRVGVVHVTKEVVGGVAGTRCHCRHNMMTVRERQSRECRTIGPKMGSVGQTHVLQMAVDVTHVHVEDVAHIKLL